MTFDLICAGIALVFVLFGLFKGLIRQLFGVAGFIGGLVLARMFAEPLGKELAPSVGLSPVVATAAVSIAIFIAVEVVSTLIGNFLHSHLGALTGTVNRLGGAAIGLAKGLLVVWVVASLAGLLHKHLPQAEGRLPLLDKLDLKNSQAARAAIDTNFLGDLESKFGKFSGLPAPLRDAANKAKRAAEQAAGQAKKVAEQTAAQAKEAALKAGAEAAGKATEAEKLLKK